MKKNKTLLDLINEKPNWEEIGFIEPELTDRQKLNVKNCFNYIYDTVLINSIEKPEFEHVLFITINKIVINYDELIDPKEICDDIINKLKSFYITHSLSDYLCYNMIDCEAQMLEVFVNEYKKGAL